MDRAIEKWGRSGGSPLLRLDLRARDRQLSTTDRACIEMKCLLTAICYAGGYGQVNLPSMASIEVLCRRVA